MRYLTALETRIVTGTSCARLQHEWFSNHNIQTAVKHEHVQVYRETLPDDIVAPLVAYERQGYSFVGGAHGFANPPAITGSE